MSSCAHERLRRTNELSDLYGIPLFNQRIARRTHMHVQGDIHLVRNRHDLWNTVICVLMVWNMHARQCLLTIVRHDFSPHFYNLPVILPKTGDISTAP